MLIEHSTTVLGPSLVVSIPSSYMLVSLVLLARNHGRWLSETNHTFVVSTNIHYIRDQVFYTFSMVSS